MRTFPVPFNDPARLAAIQSLPNLQNTDEPVFEKICETVRDLFDCPVAQLSVVEEETQWSKSVVGMDLPPLPRDVAFCAHTIMSAEPLVVPDLAEDARFSDNPLVTADPKARFYAGAPVVLSSGYRIGSLCALDTRPHDIPSDAQIRTLQKLAETMAAALERTPRQEGGDPTTDGHEEFLALVGHELRTPLTSVAGYVDLLENRLQGPEARLASAAAKASRHLGRLVERIISYSNSKTGELRLAEEEVDLRDLVDEVLAIHGPGIEGRKKSLSDVRVAVVEPMRLDRAQMETALSALIENATLHGGASLSLEVSARPDRSVEIAIADDGSLRSRRTLEELFRPFTVGEDLDTRSEGGLGLGLPLTRKIIEMHGGRLSVEAQPGRTVGRIHLPAWRRVGPAGQTAA